MKEIMPLTEFIEVLLEHTGYEKAIKEEGRRNRYPEQKTSKNLFLRPGILKEIMGSRVSGFLENLALVTDLDNWERANLRLV